MKIFNFTSGKKIFQNKILKNAGWLIGGRVCQLLVNFFVSILMARYLGPSNYGLINYAGAYIAFFTSLCTLGINSILVKELIDRPEEDGKILGTSIALRLISSLLSAITIVGISAVVDRNEPVTILVVALSSLGVIFHVFEVFNFWFQSHLQSKITAIASLCAHTITALYKVFLLVTQKSVAYFAIATSVDYICVAIFLYICYRKYNGKKLCFSIYEGKRLLSKSWHFILPSLMVAIYGQTDKMMLKHIVGEAEIGYYSIAVSICSVWCFVLSAIIDSLYPSIMQATNEGNEKQFERLNKVLYAIVFYISIIVSVVFVVFAELLIGVVYGEAYLPAVMPLRVITWYTSFSYLGVARDAWIVGKNKQKYLIYIYIFAAIANVGLNIVLIPLWGAVGAAVASLIAQMATIFVPLVIKPLRHNTILIIEAILLKGVKRS